MFKKYLSNTLFLLYYDVENCIIVHEFIPLKYKSHNNQTSMIIIGKTYSVFHLVISVLINCL